MGQLTMNPKLSEGTPGSIFLSRDKSVLSPSVLSGMSLRGLSLCPRGLFELRGQSFDASREELLGTTGGGAGEAETRAYGTFEARAIIVVPGSLPNVFTLPRLEKEETSRMIPLTFYRASLAKGRIAS